MCIIWLKKLFIIQLSACILFFFPIKCYSLNLSPAIIRLFQHEFTGYVIFVQQIQSEYWSTESRALIIDWFIVWFYPVREYFTHIGPGSPHIRIRAATIRPYQSFIFIHKLCNPQAKLRCRNDVWDQRKKRIIITCKKPLENISLIALKDPMVDSLINSPGLISFNVPFTYHLFKKNLCSVINPFYITPA